MAKKTEATAQKLTHAEARELLEKTAGAGTAETCKTPAEVASTLKSYGIEAEVSEE